MTKKLFRDVNLETPFNCTINGNEVQVDADEANSIEIGGETFIRLTDGSGHNIIDGDGKQLLLNDGIIYQLNNGVPESTNIEVTDVVPVEQYTFTISATPNDATVVINGEARSTLTADDGTEITWSVAKEGYTTQSGTYTLNGADHTEEVTLIAIPQPDVVLTLDAVTGSYTSTGDFTSPIANYSIVYEYELPPANGDYYYCSGCLSPDWLGVNTSGFDIVYDDNNTNPNIGTLSGTYDDVNNVYTMTECISKIILNSDGTCSVTVHSFSNNTDRTLTGSGDNYYAQTYLANMNDAITNNNSVLNALTGSNMTSYYSISNSSMPIGTTIKFYFTAGETPSYEDDLG